MDNSFEKFKFYMDSNSHVSVLKEFYGELSDINTDIEMLDHFHHSVSINVFWWNKTKMLINTSLNLRRIINKIC